MTFKHLSHLSNKMDYICDKCGESEYLKMELKCKQNTSVLCEEKCSEKLRNQKKNMLKDDSCSIENKVVKKMISVEGNIGVGKSTLVEELVSRGLGKIQPEPIPNALLSRFYEEPKVYAFPFQLFMLAHRLASATHREHLPTVCDRGLLGDQAFARVAYEAGNISEMDYEIYLDMMKDYRHISGITLYLICSPEVCLTRIRHRQRDSESDITLEYLESIQRAHFDAIVESMVRGKITIVVDWNSFGSFDYVTMRLLKTQLSGVGDEQWLSTSAPSENGAYVFDWRQDHDTVFRTKLWSHVLKEERVHLMNYPS